MHTRCPACQAVFRVGRSELAAAGGRVRCGECGEVFDARVSLQRELPLDEPGTDAARQAPDGLAAPPRFRETMPGLLLSELEDQHEDAGTAGHRRWPLSLAGWGLANVALVALLAGQLLFVQRDAFAQDPTLRPVLDRMCAVAGCTLPSRRAVDRIELVQRHVYAHPNVDDALLIDITVVSNAGFAQPYPVLGVTLGNLRGDPVVRRHFQPQEYLPALGEQARMAPGSPANIVLEVQDPGPEARTFDLDFY